MAYAMVTEPLPEVWEPTVLIMGEDNRIVETRHREVAREICC